MTGTFLLKLVLTPTLIAAASLASRRWGAAVAGWLVGLPLTSGPVALFLTLDLGPAFAAQAAVGTLGGLISVAAFCLAYCWLATRCGWPLSLAGSLAVFVACTALLRELALPPLATFGLVVAALVLTLLLLPRDPGAAPVAVAFRPPRWEIPARMLVATGFVVLLTAGAGTLGSRLSGLLTPLPIFAGVFAVFTHRFEGAAAALRLLRGVALGSFAFAAFFLALALLLESAGPPPAFACAILVALALQGLLGRVFGR